MCAPNKTKKGNKAFSYLFRTHLAITVSAMGSVETLHRTNRTNRTNRP